MKRPSRRPDQEWEKQRFHDLLTRGMAAAKAGQPAEAARFLRAAANAMPMDPRPWLWLASTTEDVAARREFLEQALAVEPTNMAARRGLALLGGHLSGADAEGGGGAAQAVPREPVGASARVFTCAACGGRMRYDPQLGEQRCERCGSRTAVAAREASGEEHEGVLDFVLPTARAQIWAATAHGLSCQQCGAQSVLPPDQLTTCCAFCGSEQLISSPQTRALLEPQGLLPMQLDEADARRALRGWLRHGLLTPRALAPLAGSVPLRPAYYPIWSFDATFNARWVARVKNKRDNKWEQRAGEKILFFNDLLVPGTSKIRLEQLRAVEPFDRAQLVEFDEEMLAGWPALLYDQSLADASIAARGAMARHAQATLKDRVLSGEEASDFKVIPTGYSDQSYRQLMLPLWVGEYRYKGTTYPLLINGQSGKVGGDKPRDGSRLALLIALPLLVVILTLLALWLLR